VTLAANFEAGNGAGEQYPAPAQLSLEVDGVPWEVSNAGGQEYGVITLAEATAQSVNTVYAQALAKVGPEAIVDLAGRLGIRSELDAEPSIALGTEEVTPLELTSMYSTLSRSGVRIDPYVITKVEDAEGTTLLEVEAEEEEAVEADIADTVSAVLSEGPRSGTARRAALDRPMAAKTGTTQENADAWLAGYTPEYTAVVWVGNPEGNEPIPEVDGQVVQGGTVPAMIWHDFMVEALADVPPTEFPAPNEELLGDTSPPLELTATPTVDAGAAVDIIANGFEDCGVAWFVVLEGPTSVAQQPDGDQPAATPVLVQSPPDTGSEESTRRTSVQMPPSAVPGTYQVSARCDAGAGPQPLGPTASVEVRIDPSATTTTSSTTTSTSTTTTTTTTAPQTTTTTGPRETTTTSSTEPPGGQDEEG
jgi:membrane peptidoglycan carboxypeptidase